MTPARYRVLRRLGKGGMGSVYLALHLAEHNFRQQVALKVLLPEADDVAEFEVRLRDEARVLGWLRHAGIVRADRLTRIDGRWAVVMEYVEGIDLHGLLRSVRPPLRAAIEIVLGAAQALRAAWETLGPDGKPLALVHRDIKPSNIRRRRATASKSAGTSTRWPTPASSTTSGALWAGSASTTWTGTN